MGNKSDLKDRRIVSKEEGAELANGFKISFIETSATENINIDNAFHNLAKILVDKVILRIYCLYGQF